jgi:hypothetical protein
VETSRLDLTELINEGQQSYQPFREAFEGARSRAQSAWQRTCVEAFRNRASEMEARRAISDLALGPYVRQLSEQPNYLTALERIRGEVPTVSLPGLSREDEALGHATRNFWNDIIVAAFGQFGETLDVFGPPYAGQGAERQGGPHHLQQASADRQQGRLQFAHTVGVEGGGSFVSAALWSHFMRRSPGFPPGQGNAGIAQVRPFVPFSNRWETVSNIAPAHNKAGWGVFVASEDLNGADEQVEQNHQYWFFTDSTAWFEHHSNPGAPNPYEDHALSFQNQAPWFLIRPGRLYSMAVWCFGECDANGRSITGESFAAAAVQAKMHFCVVAQSKN